MAFPLVKILNFEAGKLKGSQKTINLSGEEKFLAEFLIQYNLIEGIVRSDGYSTSLVYGPGIRRGVIV